jgi:hypothetical protein
MANDRQQTRSHLRLKELFDPARLLFIEMTFINQVNALLLQLREDLLRRLIEVLSLTQDSVLNILDEPPYGHSHDTLGRPFVSFDALQCGHANPIEFVKVVREDPKELDPIQERVSWVIRLLKHALIETEPADLFGDQVRRMTFRSSGRA